MSDQAREQAAQLADKIRADYSPMQSLDTNGVVLLLLAFAESIECECITASVLVQERHDKATARACYEKAAQHTPITEKIFGKSRIYGCMCGWKVQSLAATHAEQDNLTDDQIRDGWTEHILALAGSPAPAIERHCEGCENPTIWEAATPTSKPGTSVLDWHHTRKERTEDGDKYFILCRRKSIPLGAAMERHDCNENKNGYCDTCGADLRGPKEPT